MRKCGRRRNPGRHPRPVCLRMEQASALCYHPQLGPWGPDFGPAWLEARQYFGADCRQSEV